MRSRWILIFLSIVEWERSDFPQCFCTALKRVIFDPCRITRKSYYKLITQQDFFSLITRKQKTPMPKARVQASEKLYQIFSNSINPIGLWSFFRTLRNYTLRQASPRLPKPIPSPINSSRKCRTYYWSLLQRWKWTHHQNFFLLGELNWRPIDHAVVGKTYWGSWCVDRPSIINFSLAYLVY